MQSIFSNINDLFAYVAAAATAIVGLGFVRLAFGKSGLVGHMALGLFLIHIAVLTRTIYWDLIRDYIDPATWDRWFAVSGGTSVNIIFNVTITYASYHALKALHLSIPESIRGNYSLIGAAFYPRLPLVSAVSDAMRSLWAWINGRR